ncbi:hypothetical protein ATO12_00520 [Aquimarina atlantica]|uniref:Uncharacterized protein n=1 Tax=Aquimarina atlantica TaxID=1317122 RepID=A0A023C076_9FLAO|nr:hypothetical protein [Aquimarina atlantica]EZH75293.1 hypothetical protein ATO12_00520 [Aquimarina atlantica]
MVTFLIILASLIVFNFVLLKLSMQSVDTDKKKSKTQKVQINSVSDQSSDKSKSSKIPNAA